jgi:hypothetical protein
MAHCVRVQKANQGIAGIHFQVYVKASIVCPVRSMQGRTKIKGY